MDAPYKGVMLCERPANVHKEPVAFIPGCATEKLEPLGLCPVKKVHAARDHSPKEIDANALHRQWVKEFAAARLKMRDDADKAHDDVQSKVESIAAFSEKLRRAVLNGEKVSDFWKAAQKRPERAKPPPSEEAPVSTIDADILADEMDSFVNKLYSEATELASRQLKTKTAAGHEGYKSSEHASLAVAETFAAAVESSSNDSLPEADKSNSKKQQRVKSAKHDTRKPAWALSEVEADAAQEEEEQELLEFAGSLDFGKFVDRLDDVELQDTFKALQDAEEQAGKAGDDKAWRKTFVRALNQAAYRQVRSGQRDDDNLSVAGLSDGALSNRSTVTARARGEATAVKVASSKAGGDSVAEGEAVIEGRWDSSSRVGDSAEAKMTAAASRLRAAEEFLLENPELKAVHSNASVRTLIAKTEKIVTAAS